MLTSHTSGRTSDACPLSRVMLAGARSGLCRAPGAAAIAAANGATAPLRASESGVELHRYLKTA